MSSWSWLAPSRLRVGGIEGAERKVDWLELFFDLIFVVIIGQLAHSLAGNPTLSGLLNFAFLFIPVWWVWIAGTYYNERFETSGSTQVFFTFLQMLPVAGLAIFVHQGLEANFIPFAASFIASRALVTFLWWRAGWNDERARPLTNGFATGFGIALLLYIAAIFTPPPIRFVLWALGLLLEPLTPLLTHALRKLDLPRLGTAWLAERYGLFVLIVMGETLVGVIRGAADNHHLTAGTGAFILLGLALAFGLFRVYFDFIGRRFPRSGIWWMIAWSNLHLILVMSIVVTGVGLLQVVRLTEGGSADDLVRWLLAGSTGVSLIVLALLELTMHPGHGPELHPIRSPLFKALAGFLAGGLCLWGSALTIFPVLLILLGLIYTHLLYHPGWEGADPTPEADKAS